MTARTHQILLIQIIVLYGEGSLVGWPAPSKIQTRKYTCFAANGFNLNREKNRNGCEKLQTDKPLHMHSFCKYTLSTRYMLSIALW